LSARQDGPSAAEAIAAMDAGDWERLENSAQFKALVAQRRRVVVPCLAVFVVVFGTFTVLASWGRHFMARQIVSGFTIAYAFALGLIVMTWLLALIYIRASNARIDPLAKAVVDSVEGDQRPALHDAPRRGGSPGKQVTP
jgi:uncharacterized membrane protein (DUF485 family)